MRQVVDDDNILHVFVVQNAQVLNVEPVFGFHAVGAGEDSEDVLRFGVEELDDGIRVGGGGGGEDEDVEAFGKLLQQFQTVRASVETQLIFLNKN